MEKDTLRMQFLSGVITESEYKVKLMEFDMNQFSMGNSSSPKASFEDKWNDVPNANKEILKKSTGKEPVKIMASSNGKNYVITKELDGKFYRYQYTQAENPGKPMGPFNREDEAKKLNESLNESMIGGIVGIGTINQIPPRAKADYETAFEHFLGEKYGLNEEEKINEGEQTIRSKSIKDYILSQIKLYPMYSAQLKSFESTIKNNQDLTKEEAKEIIEKFIKITRRTEDVFDAEMKNIKNIDYQTDRDQMAAIQGGYY